MSKGGTPDSRASERRKALWRALILHADWRALPTNIVNISETGTCIVSPDSRPAGAPIQFVLFVPDHKVGGRVMPWMMNAKVIYSVLAGNGFQLGLQFVQPDPAAIEYIRTAMRR